MRIVSTVGGLRAVIAEWREGRVRIGFVPTMGFLHSGHLALVDEARRRADRVVVSVFVNPLQFAPTEDLTRYPRDFERDRALLEGQGVDLLFAPLVEEMYPAEAAVRLDPGSIGARWEGAARPGHFAGVLTVVAKLFHQVEPDLACFGQKDIQQATLIRRMVHDLDWPIELIIVPTVREPDGLAMSSRNVFLDPTSRQNALALSRSLVAVQEGWRGGETDPMALERIGLARLNTVPEISVDYFAIVDPERLEPAVVVTADTIAAVAARVGSTRLIDNAVLGRPIQ